LIPQMVGAGSLVKPLLGLSHSTGVITVGIVVMLIVVTAGMVSTTWVQFIKGGMLVVFCTILTVMILARGLSTAAGKDPPPHPVKIVGDPRLEGGEVLSETGGWVTKPYVRTRGVPGDSEAVAVWRKLGPDEFALCQTLQIRGGSKYVNGRLQTKSPDKNDFSPVGEIRGLPDNKSSTGPLGPISFIATLQQSEVVTWRSERVLDADGITTIYYPMILKGNDLLVPGGSPTFAGIRSNKLNDKLDFLSLMLALFGGTASLPHILIRYYTVKDQASARKSTVVGIASIGFFYILTLFLGLGAMTSGTLDVTDSNMAAPLLARSFGELPFAVISAIAFTTVLGTVSGLIMAASGAVAHDLLANFLRLEMNDYSKVRAGKITAVAVGLIAIVLGILFQRLNVGFLVGWAFNVAASANLPALVMLLFWRGTTKQGITAAIFVGMIASLGWILLSQQCYRDVYGMPPEMAVVPFSQPGIVTIPLGFIVLIVVSLLTQKHDRPTSS